MYHAGEYECLQENTRFLALKRQGSSELYEDERQEEGSLWDHGNFCGSTYNPGNLQVLKSLEPAARGVSNNGPAPDRAVDLADARSNSFR